jgi:ABC-type nitrate/sulfonate/bicarbonate transport system ATPase subunit
MGASVSAPVIELRGIHHALGGLPVVQGVSFTIAPGELVALVGPSGCGKSTLLSILAGLTHPDRGEVRLDGVPAPERLGRLALMPQGDALLPWCTVRENVALGARLAGSAGADARAEADTLLARLGLAGFEEHYPHALSGGMRQRAALARTVLARADAWLLDEPLGALDALTRSDLQRVLAGTWAQERPTTLLVTHDLDEALLLADRVLVSGPSPARIVAEIPVDLPRPRTLDDTLTPAFATLRGRLMHALRGAGALA